MKKLFTLFLVLVASMSTAFAHDAEIDGIYYNLKTSFIPPMSFSYTATVTYCGDCSNEYSGSVVIPSSVTYDGTTYSVTSIGDEAFRGCYSLTSVTIPNSVTSIGGSSFEYCYFLTSITIPNSVTSIGELAFYGCESLTSVTIGNSVTSIGWATFYGCSSLTSVTIPNSVTSIGVQAFEGCSSLTSITIPNSVASIGGYAFYGCTSLNSITIPNSVTSIGYQAFYGCSSLTSPVYNAYCFAYMPSSTCAYTIPEGIKQIVGGAFYGCDSLTSITIPNSVTSIGYQAFYGCYGLKSVTNYATTPQIISSDVFENVNKTNCKLYVPAASMSLYKNAAVWQEFLIEAINTEGIDGVQTKIQCTKILRDGQIYILRGENTYTLQGVEVK